MPHGNIQAYVKGVEISILSTIILVPFGDMPGRHFATQVTVVPAGKNLFEVSEEISDFERNFARWCVEPKKNCVLRPF